MRLRPILQATAKAARSFARRIIAFLLLGMVTFLVVNPIWECQDHLDNLRHLGPHGALLLLLAVALAGVSLLKSVRSLLVCFVSAIAALLRSAALPQPVAAAYVCAAAPQSGPPLRI